MIETGSGSAHKKHIVIDEQKECSISLDIQEIQDSPYPKY